MDNTEGNVAYTTRDHWEMISQNLVDSEKYGIRRSDKTEIKKRLAGETEGAR